jgi:hypothetical protein
LVVDDAAVAAVRLDQAIDQFQAPAALVVDGRVLADRPAGAGVVDFGPQPVTGVAQPQCYLSAAVTQGVGDEFAN